MEFPVHIREKIERLVNAEDVKKLSAAARRLSENYRREENFSASSRLEILAYTAVRMPATFGAVSRALELALEDLDSEINSVLDVGAGTGAASIAAEELIDCEKILCLERDRNMLGLGRQFVENAEWFERDITKSITETAELVICSYCLNELPEKERKFVISELAKAANKILLLVEPGTPKSFELMKHTRKQLIDLGLFIKAPCPHNGECELSDNDWCHFTVRVARSKLHKQLKNADVPYEDEKFCFLAAVKEPTGEKFTRIIRRPIIESGKITLKLCAEDGISEKIVTRSNEHFKKAKKSESGDSFPII